MSDPREVSDEELGVITRVIIGKILTAEQSSMLHELITLTTTVEPDQDLLGTLPSKPKGRTGLDADLQDLIEFFSKHPDRPSVNVPKWDKDKALLRPYVQAKGVARVREMLDVFVNRSMSFPQTDFNVRFVRDQPLTIQGFVASADRLDVLMDWESEEVPYG